MRFSRSQIFPDNTLLVATHNLGKVREIAELLSPLGLNVASAVQFNLPEPEETGSSFAENAELKARACMNLTKIASLADDSGLSVRALNGAPGIYSARWAGPNKDFGLAMRKVHEELITRNVPENLWNAAFICDLCLVLPDGSAHHFEGRVEGMLTFPPRGSQGFGYDPIFIPEGETRTFGEVNSEEKHKVSHRARAFKYFLNEISTLAS